MNLWLRAMEIAQDRHDPVRYDGRGWLDLTAEERAEEILAAKLDYAVARCQALAEVVR